MILLEGTIEENVQAVLEKPELIQALDITKYDENVLLSKLLKEDPSLYKLLSPSQMTEEAYLAMLESDMGNFDLIPKHKRTDKILLKLLSIDECAIYLLNPNEITDECVKYLFIHAPFILEEFPKDYLKAVSPHMKRLKKEKVVSTYNEDEPIPQTSLNDLPDYEDEE